ncbi:siderophore ABC transporter substrate-binding protein [Aeromicrobium senzhongii]|uniref:Siderophore ABC transporter substrate-binding protein n=1 Tax=Aeromicrobium senzhongii TaxID=2663859 RepID=A0ABX6SWA8_9ACTN|nr:siderophore ABC transporter substrate-binding protein [Aeromicrobium senzhongii]MTB87231.1 ABC transporter substrate-binding protein [Aeromicrobium senzhongii]QNL95699.1 siderophore ABC transporter substrate-binding protein [Aeromicrobium senzhongii]
MSLRRRFAAVLTLPLLGLALSACGNENESASGGDTETITVTDALGDEEVPLNPKSVVVFDMGVLDTLDTLGVDAVTGVAKGGATPSYLKKYDGDDYVAVGDLFEPNLEAIPRAKPDLIIVGGRSASMHDTLEDTFEGVPVLDMSVDQNAYLDSSRKNILTLASIFEKEKQAEEILAGYDERIAAVKKQASSAGKGLVLLTSGGEVTAYSINSRFGFVHDVFGVPAATGELGDSESRHGEAVSFEFIRKVNPDLLYVVDRDSAIGEDGKSAEEILDNALVKKTNAWKNEKVTYVDAEAWYIVIGGLTSLGTLIDDVEKSLA